MTVPEAGAYTWGCGAHVMRQRGPTGAGGLTALRCHGERISDHDACGRALRVAGVGDAEELGQVAAGDATSDLCRSGLAYDVQGRRRAQPGRPTEQTTPGSADRGAGAQQGQRRPAWAIEKRAMVPEEVFTVKQELAVMGDLHQHEGHMVIPERRSPRRRRACRSRSR